MGDLAGRRAPGGAASLAAECMPQHLAPGWHLTVACLSSDAEVHEGAAFPLLPMAASWIQEEPERAETVILEVTAVPATPRLGGRGFSPWRVSRSAKWEGDCVRIKNLLPENSLIAVESGAD